ncbi:MAG: autotransporter outer membrane beta-barrel domain-containing protein [Opitutales bacterium]
MHKKYIFLTLPILGLVTPTFGLNTGDTIAYVTNLYIGAESLRQSSDFTDNQVFGAGGLSAGVGYADYDYDNDPPRNFDGDFQTGSFSLAYVHQFESFNVGLSFSYIDGESEGDGERANPGKLESDADGWLISLFAGKQWERLSLSAKGTVGELSVDTTRQTDAALTLVPPRPARISDSDLTLYQIELVALYALLSNADMDLSPFVKLGYTSLENDGFEESATFDSFRYEEFEDEIPYAELGIKASWKSFGPFQPYAGASIWQDLADDEVNLEVSSPTSDERDVPDAMSTVLKAKLGFDYLISEDISLGASLGYLSGDELDGMNLSLAASWQF